MKDYVRDSAEEATRRLLFAIDMNDDATQSEKDTICEAFEKAIRESHRDGYIKGRQDFFERLTAVM